MRLPATLLLVAVLACSAPTAAPSGSPAPADLANGLGTTPAQLKQRLASGCVRTFSKVGDPFLCCAIDSILIATADVTAAITTANDFRTRARELGSIETDLGETIGDESRAFTVLQPTADSVLITLTVLFRYANVVDAVEVTGRIGSFERVYVLEFARKQVQRLRADAEKR